MGNFRKHSPRVFWSEAEVNILMEHYPSLSAAELLEKLPGRTIRVIQCKANGLGLSRTKPKKRTAEQTREAKRKHMAEMIGAAHDIMLARGDFVLSAALLERIYLAMERAAPPPQTPFDTCPTCEALARTVMMDQTGAA